MTDAATVPRYGQGADEAAFISFRRTGVVVFDALWPAARLASLLADLERLHPEYIGKAAEKPGDRLDIGDERFISPLAYVPPFDCSDLLLHPTLVQFFTRALGRKFVFEAIGVVSALPGATEQRLHSDGEGLFEEIGIDRMLPPVAMTVVIPLVRMDAVSGMTALWLGSHLHRNDVSKEPWVAPEIEVGACVAWDFRLRHRGLANTGDQARPLLYITVCRPFWIDHKNFAPGVNAKLVASRAALDQLYEQDRARFARATLID